MEDKINIHHRDAENTEKKNHESQKWRNPERRYTENKSDFAKKEITKPSEKTRK